MKKRLLILLLCLIPLPLFLSGCNHEPAETKTSKLVPPISDVSDGTSLPDTWTLTNTSDDLKELVIALNQDDTFTLLIVGSVPGAFSSTDGALLYGEYLNTKDNLTLGIANHIEEAQFSVDPVVFNYQLDKDTLILSYNGIDYHFKRGLLRHNF